MHMRVKDSQDTFLYKFNLIREILRKAGVPNGACVFQNRPDQGVVKRLVNVGKRSVNIVKKIVIGEPD